MLDTSNIDKREIERIQELLLRVPLLRETNAEFKMVESVGKFLNEKGDKTGGICFNLCMYNLGKFMQMLSIANQLNGYVTNDAAGEIFQEIHVALKDRKDLIEKLEDYDYLTNDSAYRYGFYAGLEARFMD
ncbi:hypothetical protein [Anaerosinus massiliensis]|uniref:hypothetical protein n=1 Tax=Massilibacillus massiliensis TaxID=1806837 RepID=UPI000DA63200|nr:hypothetical protein [Massilibacillus massiliensis]